jgi:hypothetical protein
MAGNHLYYYAALGWPPFAMEKKRMKFQAMPVLVTPAKMPDALSLNASGFSSKTPF